MFFNLLAWWVYDISHGLESWSIDDHFLISSTAGLTVHQIKPEHVTKRTHFDSLKISLASVLNVPIQAWKNANFYRWISIGVTFPQENHVYICQIQSRRTTMATFVCCFGTRKHKSPRLPCTMRLGYGLITLSNCREPIKMCPINIKTLIPLPRMFFMSE